MFGQLVQRGFQRRLLKVNAIARTQATLGATRDNRDQNWFASVIARVPCFARVAALVPGHHRHKTCVDFTGRIDLDRKGERVARFLRSGDVREPCGGNGRGAGYVGKIECCDRCLDRPGDGRQYAGEFQSTP